ncbi:tRNA-dependent cyclodipeptide synthase [Kitasatospora sp. McL0602]|uniref:tRNA-dependent cyclodipeptide synthase n=1 Tax=Kitasatospora sp. McL0602 TaxID=3439530 RepID=UPI003F8AC6FA
MTSSAVHTPPALDGPALGGSAPAAAPFAVRALTAGCARLAARRAHACVGISPFNGYFHARRIAELARWALGSFDQVHFFLPDSLAAHTLEAVGYPPERAAFKARRQGQHLHNKITTALHELGVPDPASRVLTSTALADHPRYADLHQQARCLFDSDPGFRSACLAAGNWVLERRLPPGTAPSDAQLLTAGRYLLGELPLFLDTPGLTGVAESVFCYHQTPRFLRDLFERRLACTPELTQGYLTVVPAAV